MNGPFRTGLALLDEHIGGFLRGKAYLVFGEAGSGKSLLGLQYALCGIEWGEKAVYLSMERPADLLSQAASLGLDLEPALTSGDLIYLEYDQDVTGRIMRFGWKPFLTQLEPLGGPNGARRVVFDPVHPLFAGSTEEGRLRYDLRYLVETLEEWGWTALFLNERGATQGHPSLYRVFSETCAGVFELQDEVENLESSKYLFIHKLRQPSDRMRKIPFQILQGVGLVEAKPPAASPPSAPKDTPEGGTPGSPAPSGPPRVLIADDDPFIRSLLKKGLREEFEVLMAEDGVEALTLTLSGRPDVLLLDVMLPKLTGFEVCRSLRATGFSQPIFFVSSLEDPNERIRGLTLGANDFIAKPFQIREVVAKVRTASRYRLLPAPAARPDPDLDMMLRAAHSRVLPAAEFEEKLEAACQNVGRFGSSLGVVRFGWEQAATEASVAESFRRELERQTRPEDLLTFPESDEALVVLNSETRAGTLGYLRRLRGEWEGAGAASGGDWPACLRVSFAIVEPDQEGACACRVEILRRLGRPELELFQHPLFVPVVFRETRQQPARATGTDG